MAECSIAGTAPIPRGVPWPLVTFKRHPLRAVINQIVTFSWLIVVGFVGIKIIAGAYYLIFELYPPLTREWHAAVPDSALRHVSVTWRKAITPPSWPMRYIQPMEEEWAAVSDHTVQTNQPPGHSPGISAASSGPRQPSRSLQVYGCPMARVNLRIRGAGLLDRSLGGSAGVQRPIALPGYGGFASTARRGSGCAALEQGAVDGGFRVAQKAYRCPGGAILRPAPRAGSLRPDLAQVSAHLRLPVRARMRRGRAKRACETRTGVHARNQTAERPN